MQRNGIIILRTALAIMFLWVGILIFLDTTTWAYPLLPWVKKTLTIGGSLKPILRAAAILDVIVGAALILNVGTWIAALVGGLTLLGALLMSGATMSTPLQVGLLGTCLALALLSAPETVLRKMRLM